MLHLCVDLGRLLPKPHTANPNPEREGSAVTAPLQPALRAGPNLHFQAFDMCWHSLESGDWR